MSELSDLYNKTITVKRGSTSSITGTDTLATVYTGSCLVRPVSDRTQLFNESNWGKEFRVWLDAGANVKVGDTVFIDGDKYGVQGDPPYEDLEDDSESHIELRVFKK